ncbi:hypothetical protein BCR34DRAFT_41063 [Clohesyomyces aquaticus]|uniref:Uncharacterized protein n=1 Tax=Clohesyomyces aquaticus TaxID=1231657 RepID=A0A1Y1Z723_9PLEO|nr:hypothetical protein BCR34DRAFT_41063 [Clohesyomyces aquaticus]
MGCFHDPHACWRHGIDSINQPSPAVLPRFHSCLRCIVAGQALPSLPRKVSLSPFFSASALLPISGPAPCKIKPSSLTSASCQASLIAPRITFHLKQSKRAASDGTTKIICISTNALRHLVLMLTSPLRSMMIPAVPSPFRPRPSPKAPPDSRSDRKRLCCARGGSGSPTDTRPPGRRAAQRLSDPALGLTGVDGRSDQLP